jgi:ADP-dependent NAD(P)H-hydrate dehydratase
MGEIVEVDEEVLRAWPLASPGADKESRGRILVVGGTATTPGAVLLAAEAALRSGAGKLTVATAETVAAHVATALPEAQVHSLPELADGSVDPKAADLVVECGTSSDAVLFGPGFTDLDASVALLRAAVPHIEVTVVIDALASAYVTEEQDRLRSLTSPLVLTLNPDELAKSLREEEVQDPVLATAELARRTGAVVVCGGSDKLIGHPAGDMWRLTGGGPGLGVSGSGDVQAGIVAGLVARGAEPAQAAVWGGYLHGRAGERLAERVGTVGFLAREISGEVPHVLVEVGQQERAAES